MPLHPRFVDATKRCDRRYPPSRSTYAPTLPTTNSFQAKQTKLTPQDLEAQKPLPQRPDDDITDPAHIPPQAPSTVGGGGSGGSAPAYTRSGRGGAGNFVDVVPSSTSTPTSPTSSQPPPTPPPKPQYPQQQHPPPRSGLSGRGGAGNWTSAPEGEEESRQQQGGGGDYEEGEEYDPEQERKRREALDAHILQDIRESLPQPPKIHYMHGPGRGRKPEQLPT